VKVLLLVFLAPANEFAGGTHIPLVMQKSINGDINWRKKRLKSVLGANSR